MGGKISPTRAINGVFALSKVKRGPNMVLNGPRKEVTLVIKGLKIVYFFTQTASKIVFLIEN